MSQRAARFKGGWPNLKHIQKYLGSTSFESPKLEHFRLGLFFQFGQGVLERSEFSCSKKSGFF